MRARIALALAAAALGLGALAATYTVAFTTDVGRRADARIFNRIGDHSSFRKFGHRIGGDKLNLIAAGGVVLGATLLSILSLLDKTRLRGMYVLTLIGGAFATTEFIKPPLGEWGRRLAPSRVAADAFPSGHATLAMAIVLAAFMALPVGRRSVSTLCAAALATLLGLLIVVGGLHPPSDVIGGSLVAGIWAALLTPLVRPVERSVSAEPREHRLSGIGLGAVTLAVFVFVGAIAVYVQQVFGIHRALLFLVIGLALASVLIVAVIGALCELADRPR